MELDKEGYLTWHYRERRLLPDKGLHLGLKLSIPQLPIIKSKNSMGYRIECPAKIRHHVCLDEVWVQ